MSMKPNCCGCSGTVNSKSPVKRDPDTGLCPPVRRTSDHMAAETGTSQKRVRNALGKTADQTVSLQASKSTQIFMTNMTENNL